MLDDIGTDKTFKRTYQSIMFWYDTKEEAIRILRREIEERQERRKRLTQQAIDSMVLDFDTKTETSDAELTYLEDLETLVKREKE
jgi:hypothetical protein